MIKLVVYCEEGLISKNVHKGVVVTTYPLWDVNQD